MNRYAIQHIVDSAYCFPVSEKEIVIRLRTAKNDIKKAEIIYESKYVIGMTQQRAQMTRHIAVNYLIIIPFCLVL